jgi:UbiD family decarboxylase
MNTASGAPRAKRSLSGSATELTNASRQDLRVWLAEMEAAGEIRHIEGADREREIGGIVDIYQRKIGNPALLFDDIPGYPKGYRVLANILTSIRRINMTMGNPADGSEIELVRHWRKYMKEAKMIPPVTVASSALLMKIEIERCDHRSWIASRPYVSG